MFRKGKFVLICLILTMLATSCATATQNKKERDGDIIKSIEFAQPAAAYESEFKKITEALENADKDLFSQELPVYRIVPRKKDKHYDNEVLSVFEMKDCSMRASSFMVTYENNSEEVDIFPSGSFSYKNSEKKSYSDDIPISLSNEEVKKQAEEFLLSRNLLPEGFYALEELGTTKREITEPGADFPSEPITMEKSPTFVRRIDGYELLGTSKIIVNFNYNGIIEVTSLYNDYELHKKIKCISLDEAIQKINTSASLYDYDLEKVTGSIDELKLTNVEIVYYDSSPLNLERNTHIQPCYHFSGTVSDSKGNVSTFYALVPALPASETVDNPPLEEY